MSIAHRATVGQATATGPDDPVVSLYRNVLVPLDGSDDAQRAVPTGQVLAVRFAARLHAVSAAPNPLELATLREAAASALGFAADDRRVHTAATGDSAPAITTLAEQLDPCLVCMTTKGHGRFVGALVGSTARSVLTTSHRPILVLAPLVGRTTYLGDVPPTPFLDDHIVACVDATNPSHDAVDEAARWASALGMSMTILTVRASTNELSDAAAHNAARRTLDELAATIAEASIDVRTRVEHSPIGPADRIRTFLTEHPAALLVASKSARSGMQRLAARATAIRIAATATIPTLMVPANTVDAAQPGEP